MTLKNKKIKTMAFLLTKVGKVTLSTFVIVLISVCVGCGGSNRAPLGSRYQLKHDKYPTNAPGMHHVRNAEPKLEPKSRQGNPSSYVVLNKKYYVKPSSHGYVERGIASFYGTKFHGHKTSNGEVYDMYQMTAAHKTLPIPTYVEVKNLNNGKKIIVRVNDRGPFHSGRIIDLSYAAAHKLGMLGRGTANVEVKAIDVKRWLAQKGRGENNDVVAEVATIEPTRTISSDTLHLQMGAFGDKNNALAFADKIKAKIAQPVNISEVASGTKKLFKVTIGPLSRSINLDSIKSKLLAANLPSPIIVNLD